MYELFILGKLMHRPMHGYLLQSVIHAALGPFRKLSWGTLYPLLRKLERDGFIVVLRSEADDPRGTRNYRTTSRGRARFVELMRSPVTEERDYRDLFRIKLSNFGHIGREDRVAILTEYRGFLAEIGKHSEAMSREVRKAPGMASEERPYVLIAIDHQRHLAVSEIAWVDTMIRTMEGNHEKGMEKDTPVVARSAGPRGGRTRARSTKRGAPRK